MKESVRKIKGDIVESRDQREQEFEQKVSDLLAVEQTFEETIEGERLVGESDDRRENTRRASSIEC